MRGATRARANAPRTPRAPRASARGGRDGASARPARAFPAKWNPFVNVPDAPDRMTDADRARADDSDGVLGYHDAARAMRASESLRSGTSRPDEYFAEMGLRFDFDDDVASSSRDFEELNRLFVSVGFSARAHEKLEKAVDNSYASLWVTTTRNSRFAKEGQVVGFARATSDGVFHATIWDVAVSPAWQRHGIGQGLIERLVDRMLDEEICNVGLYSERKVVKLYEKLGFSEKCPEPSSAMQFRFNLSPY